MQVYNTLTRRTETLVPKHGRRINFFVCGPTVYDKIHLGNARTFVFFDMAVKYLRFSGYSVFYLENITDIDDKVINRSKEENRDPREVAESNFDEFLTDMELLGVDAVSHYAFATDYIPEIRRQIEGLLRRGAAYLTSDGVYFDISTFPDYGKLSRQNIAENRPMVRHQMSLEKKSPEDFVLWKFRGKDEVWWPASFGSGRPGWHIEDTAITNSFFGSTYDIHGGGSDLIFPHHEAEVAQMRTLSGRKTLAKYWIHSAMLNLSSEKMAKSTGNLVLARSVVEKYDGETTRLFLLNASYRTELLYDDSSMHEASQNQSKIQNLYDRLLSRAENGNVRIDVDTFMKKFVETMDKDFDTRSAIAMLLEFVSEVNRQFNELSTDSRDEIISAFDQINSFLGLIRKNSTMGTTDLLDTVVDVRNELRKRKMFDLADMIRKNLDKNGIIVEDEGDKSTWRRK